MKTVTPDVLLDITADSCPITFVRTKLTLEAMTPGQVLEVVMQGLEPLRNVPRSIKEEGHKVLVVENIEGDKYRLLIERGVD